MAGQADSLNPILFALFANASIAIAQGAAAVVTSLLFEPDVEA